MQGSRQIPFSPKMMYHQLPCPNRPPTLLPRTICSPSQGLVSPRPGFLEEKGRVGQVCCLGTILRVASHLPTSHPAMSCVTPDPQACWLPPYYVKLRLLWGWEPGRWQQTHSEGRCKCRRVSVWPLTATPLPPTLWLSITSRLRWRACAMCKWGGGAIGTIRNRPAGLRCFAPQRLAQSRQLCQPHPSSHPVFREMSKVASALWAPIPGICSPPPASPQGNPRGATPWPQASLHPTPPLLPVEGTQRVVGDCRKEAILPAWGHQLLAARTCCPSCLYWLGPLPPPPHTHSLLPFWVDLKDPSPHPVLSGCSHTHMPA
jgi:hypothetical protein